MIRGLRIASLAVALVATLTLAGCAARVHAVRAKLRAGTADACPGRVERIRRSRPHAPTILRAQAEDAAYRIETLAFPSVGENGQDGNLVTARHYRSKARGPSRSSSSCRSGASTPTLPMPSPLVCGVTEPARLTSSRSSATSPCSIWTPSPTPKTRRSFRSARADDRALRQHRDRHPARGRLGADPTRCRSERIALIGFSMGALVAGVAWA